MLFSTEGHRRQRLQRPVNVQELRVRIYWRSRAVGVFHAERLFEPFRIEGQRQTQRFLSDSTPRRANPSFFSPTGKGSDQIKGQNHAWHPVESVSWEDAAEFCRRLNVKEKREPMYARIADAMTVLDGDGYQLPTEAQWEFAARAGTTSLYWSGDSTDSLSKVAWTGLKLGKEDTRRQRT
jgi:formylglycine-generating enzyme required for sulfatase activity